MDTDPRELLFHEIIPLLKRRSAVIVTNNELFYADLNLGKVRKLLQTQNNQKDMSEVISKCTYDYQLADQKDCKLIRSLTGITPPFEGFYQLFQKKNKYSSSQGREHICVNYHDFMVRNTVKILNLYEFMGEDVFLFMKKMLSPSPQSLKRYFDALILIPVEYFQLLQSMGKKFNTELTKGESQSYAIFLTLIGQLELILIEINQTKGDYDFSKKDLIKKLALTLEEAHSSKELTEFLTKEISTLYKTLLKLPENCVLDISLFEQDPLLLSRLLTARNAMKENQLNTVFDTLIEYDLRVDVQFADFANNPTQVLPLGHKLSLHNQKIETELLEAGINTKLAFNFPETKAFSTGDKQLIDLPLLANALYADIKNLDTLLMPKTSITFFEEQGEKLKTKESIRQIISQVEKKSGTIQIKVILNGALDKHLNDLERRIKTLLSQEVSNELQEHGKHFIDHKNQLIKASEQIKVQPKLGKAKEKAFEVKQWDKKKMNTFLLGDYLSCCLAPDGGQFPAIVQRRIDSAMMMHVVYDKELNQPVCGNWLFFAHDTQNPKAIYVVANFFEIRASYGLNKELSNKMVGELLDFTGDYAETIGAKGFLLRPLTYGLIPDFKGRYQKTKITIEKIGGFFYPGFDNNASVESYYLNALDLDKFYVYNPEACANLIECSALTTYL
jgi:hypothetical protein